MQTIARDIVVDRPRSAVYAQVKRFEDYPDVLKSAKDVERIDDHRLRWTMNLGPMERQYEVEIRETRPDELIAWRASEDDFKEAGEIRLEDAGDDKTRVRLSVAYDLDSVVLRAADAVGAVERRLDGDLERLKEHLERA